ncbi:hypothetical protein F66182_4381 [Fusarium sp. NRRL 66182]|nr:hypothetical protein F66182_4381 [Fusarium sp. NRRL 66182]
MPSTEPAEAGALWIDNLWHGRAWSWEKAVWARQEWQEISGGKPFLIKGIQRADDVVKAADLGFEGIVVSHHAGQQVDGAIGSLDALEQIAERVGDGLVVPFVNGVGPCFGCKICFCWATLDLAGLNKVEDIDKSLLASLLGYWQQSTL